MRWRRGTRRGSRAIRRSAGAAPAAASYGQVWPGINYRATINDNMLVTVMIETLEGRGQRRRDRRHAGVDVVILGNNDLSSFSGWQQNDPRYQDALIKVHDAALKYGKYYGNAGQQYLNGYAVSADTRMVQDGPARDGWQRPGRGRATGSAEEPVIGVASGATRGAAPAGPSASKSAASCWPWMAAQAGGGK